MMGRSHMTDLSVSPSFSRETKAFFPRTVLPLLRMTKPIKLRPEVAYTPWEDRAKELLVLEMWQRRISYKELARRLEAYGIDELPDQINRKVNRKRFSAAFLLACLAAMEVAEVSVPTQLGAPTLRK